MHGQQESHSAQHVNSGDILLTRQRGFRSPNHALFQPRLMIGRADIPSKIIKIPPIDRTPISALALFATLAAHRAMDRWGCPYEGLPISEAPSIATWIRFTSRWARYYGSAKYYESTSESSFAGVGRSEGGALGVLVILGKDCLVTLQSIWKSWHLPQCRHSQSQ